MKIQRNGRLERRVTILLTGFGGFPGAPVNPSATIVYQICRRARRRLERCGIDIAAAVLPVDFFSFGEELAKKLAATEPEAVLHLGLAGRRQAISVETKARNRVSLLRPDARKHLPERPTLCAGAPAQLAVRLPALRLTAVLRRTGVPARLSSDAGAYVCNAALYHTLSTSILLAGFIHVPWPRARNRPLQRGGANAGRPTHAAMVRAVTSALILIGTEARRLRGLRRRLDRDICQTYRKTSPRTGHTPT